MHCAVVGCTTRGQSKAYKHEIFFEFPKDANMCKAWKYACGRPDDFCTKTATICELHFEKSDYEKKIEHDGMEYKTRYSLKSYAIPTMNLSKLSGNHNVAVKGRPEITDRTYFNKCVSEPLENVTHDTTRRKCAVSSCNARNNPMFDFPNPTKNKKIYLEWLSLCQNKELEKIPPENINKSYGICEAHFGKKILTLHDAVPTLQLPGRPKPAAVQEEIHEPSQLCRLCFNQGTVNVFSCKYYKKVLSDIIKTFVPIEIKKDDVSTLVCQNCKCEAIRFYNFLLKSLQVEEYFQAIAREVNSGNETLDCVVLVEPNVSLIQVSEDQQHLHEDVTTQTITLSDGDNDDERGVEVEPSLLRKCLTAGQNIEEEPPKKTDTESGNVEEIIFLSDEEENEYLVPNYVMEYFHSYVKNPNKKRKVGRRPKEVEKEVSDRGLDTSLEELLEGTDVEIHNKKHKSGKQTRLKKLLSPDVESGDTIICIHCNKVIDNIEEFNEHCQLENHPPLFACSVCHRIFDNQLDLEEHYDTHRKNENCMCDRCGKQFSKRDSLHAHLTFVHSKNDLKYDCAVCNKKFATNYRLKLHMRVHSNDRPYCCEKCGAVFTMLAYLRNHQTIHSDYKPHKCLICNKGFRRRHKLAIHLTMHTGERKYSCGVCGISYKRKVNLTRHNRRHHVNPTEDVEEHPRSCTQCDFVCNFSAQLKLHMLKVHKSYTCTICNMTFSNYQPYYNHKFKHYPNKKKFECKYCKKRFINATLLGVHMVVHTGKKNFQCELCLRRFSQRPHLQSHLLTHTGEKPHKCKYCTKSFAHLSTLVVHERIHTGETPYVCQFCNKGFGHLTNYKKHVFSQHGVVMPKTRDYSSFKKVEDGEGTNDQDVVELVTEVAEEYILINEDLMKSEPCEIISDSNSVLEIVEDVV